MEDDARNGNQMLVFFFSQYPLLTNEISLLSNSYAINLNKNNTGTFMYREFSHSSYFSLFNYAENKGYLIDSAIAEYNLYTYKSLVVLIN